MGVVGNARALGAGVAAVLLVGSGWVGAAPATAAAGFDPVAPEARIGGPNRYGTAAAIAVRTWGRADTVVVVNGEGNGVDGVSASYLAGVLDAPVLLTRRWSVPAETQDALRRLRPAEVVVVGAASAVSGGTYNALTAGRDGQRIAGEDRWATSAAVVRAGLAAAAAKGIPAPGTVLLTRGDQRGQDVPGDALGLLPIAYREHVPIVLNADDDVPQASLDLLREIAPQRVDTIGDSTGERAERQLRRALPDVDLEGWVGDDRTGVANAVTWLPAAEGFSRTTVGLVDGSGLDALAAGPAAGRQGFPLLLTASPTDLGYGTAAYLRHHRDTLTTGRVFGNERSVTPLAAAKARSIVTRERQEVAAFDPVNHADPAVRVRFTSRAAFEAVTLASFDVQRLSGVWVQLAPLEKDPATLTVTLRLRAPDFFRLQDAVVLHLDEVLDPVDFHVVVPETDVWTPVLVDARGPVLTGVDVVTDPARDGWGAVGDTLLLSFDEPVEPAGDQLGEAELNTLLGTALRYGPGTRVRVVSVEEFYGRVLLQVEGRPLRAPLTAGTTVRPAPLPGLTDHPAGNPMAPSGPLVVGVSAPA